MLVFNSLLIVNVIIKCIKYKNSFNKYIKSTENCSQEPSCLPLVKQKLVLKEIAPENFLGKYLTKKNLSNVEIYSKTGIPTTDLSRMRNGEIKSIPAKRLYLISLVSGDPISAILKAVYPNLVLVHEIDLMSNKIKATTTPIGNILFSLEQYTFEIISYKTGIKLSRLRNLATKESAVILSHELYLIEMACNRKPGSLFDELFKGLKLNSPTEQNRLQSEAGD